MSIKTPVADPDAIRLESETYRDFFRKRRKRDPMFHDTRKGMARNNLSEISTNDRPEDREFVHALLDEIEDGFFQNFIGPEDIGLTWESWRELCRKHEYSGLARKNTPTLKELLKDDCDQALLEKEKEATEGVFYKADVDLSFGDVTLEDMDLTPEEWEKLCEKLEYFSLYRFYGCPKLFGNMSCTVSIKLRKQREDSGYSIQGIFTGAVIDKKDVLTPQLSVVAYLVKNDSGAKRRLGVGDFELDGFVYPPQIAGEILFTTFGQQAVAILATGDFIEDTLKDLS